MCYHFDEKYSWDHKCKSKPQLLFLENDSKPTEVNNPLLLPPPHGPDHELSSVDPSSPLQLAISYNALAGGCSVSTLRFQGTVFGKPVQVLLDGGSTHNFVQTRVASYLNLTVTTTPSFFVLVDSGECLPCDGIIRQVPLVIQNQEILVDFFVFPIQGWDMVLGVEWLATLGPVLTDYSSSIF